MKTTIEKETATSQAQTPCSIWRRMGAILYDFILLFCVTFIAWQPVPLLSENLNPVLGRTMKLGYLTLICFSFFAWFWCHGGQTLGMRTWKIKLVNMDLPSNDVISFKAAWLRFIAAIFSWACFGIGFIWAIFHPQKQAWHDIYSRTKLIVVDRNR